jgi:hypothetical protein
VYIILPSHKTLISTATQNFIRDGRNWFSRAGILPASVERPALITVNVVKSSNNKHTRIMIPPFLLEQNSYVLQHFSLNDYHDMHMPYEKLHPKI